MCIVRQRETMPDHNSFKSYLQNSYLSPVILTQPVKLFFRQLKMPVGFFELRKHSVFTNNPGQKNSITVGHFKFHAEQRNRIKCNGAFAEENLLL